MINTNTIITVYADRATAIGETTEAPRDWEYLQSKGGARRHAAEAIIEGVDHDADALATAGIDFLAGIWYTGSDRTRREIKIIMASYQFAAPDYRTDNANN